MTSKLTNVVTGTKFWFGVDRESLVFDHICKSLDLCESDSSTMSTAFASILYVRMVMKEARWIPNASKDSVYGKLVRQVNHDHL